MKATERTIFIGNSPSSGSTLFADILDSLPGFYCGPETRIFSVDKIYNLKKFNKRRLRDSVPFSIYKQKNRVNHNNLSIFGLNRSEFYRLLSTSVCISSVLESLKNLLHEQGHDFSTFCEKTPENINCIGCIRKYFPDAYFIHIVRNPVYVYLSLKKRGFSDYMALLTWFFDVVQFLPHQEDEKCILIKYEDLVNEPAHEINRILRLTNHTVSYSIEEIQNFLTSNGVRKGIRRVSSWSQDYGKIGNANHRKLSPKDIDILSNIYHVGLNSELARFYNVPEVSYMDAVEMYGYSTAVESLVPKYEKKSLVAPTLGDRAKFVKKAFHALLSGKEYYSIFHRFLNPIVDVRY